jgi:hypothetical protein
MQQAPRRPPQGTYWYLTEPGKPRHCCNRLQPVVFKSQCCGHDHFPPCTQRSSVNKFGHGPFLLVVAGDLCALFVVWLLSSR